MPSDDRMGAAMAALAASRDQYRSAVATTLEEVRAELDRNQVEANDRVTQLAAELGGVGPELIDPARLASVMLAEPDAQPATLEVMRRALAVLEELAARADDAFALELAPGESLYQAVAGLLSDLGRAMGAARVVDAARTGRHRPAEHDRYLQAFPFGQWSQAERLLGPPVVIALDGADLRPAGLAEFLDGGEKIVLIARGETSPAPLVRLITPHAFVAQTDDPAVVKRLGAADGPGVVALMPAGTARFVHDPAAGAALGQRLSLSEVPSLDGKKRFGPFTAAQQREELEQLKALQAAAAAGPAGASLVAGGAGADPVDKLAAWLLQQADLSGA
jgi:hypothetical protein